MNKYCCSQMEKNITLDCKVHSDEFECPDILVSYIPKFDQYGLIVHDGGTSCISISFCPWCGFKLPESKRDLWYDTLENMGIDISDEKSIPIAFKTSAWYKKLNSALH